VASTNGTSPLALAAAKLRELHLKPAQEAAVTRLETQALYYSDKPIVESLSDEMTPANRRLVERALRASFYHPPPDPRPATDPALLQRIAEAAAVVEARRLAADAALDSLILKQLALGKARNPDEVEQRRAELQVAEEANRIAHEAHQQAQAALVTLYVERDNRARAARLAESTK
jgi:hypothetical protein